MNEQRILELKALLPRCRTRDRIRLGERLERLLRAPPHPAALGGQLDRLTEQAERSVESLQRRLDSIPAIHYPEELPITARLDDILQAIQEHQVVILAGETGSGKTTQIPKMCLEAGFGASGRIGCTQPRRVAALSISKRIAEELGVEWGKKVGCKIRFNDQSEEDTLIKMMTDGILLAETQGDPLLGEYEMLIVDEAHERSLNIDFLLGYLKLLLPKRPDLKLIITSATIDTESFSKAFGGAPILEVSGRVFPVEVIYAPLDLESEEEGELTYIDAAVREAEKILLNSHRGDVLIFMPGERDIRETRDQLLGRFGGGAEVVPLFGRLSNADQQRVFAPSPRRKLVIATNIAETSLTIPGIRFVIDSGLARISRYNPRTRTKRLPVEAISQSSANQRKGRSGRVEEGVCIRLYSEQDFQARPAYTQPEIQRANLAEVILRMKAFHLGEIETFPFINPPAPQAIQSGYQLLQELGALDEGRGLTPLGMELARLPIDPTVGRMILQAIQEDALADVLVIAAGLSIQDPRERPMDQREAADQAHRRFADPRSDFLSLLNIWTAYHDEWDSLRTQNQLRKFCKSHFLSYARMREWRDLHAQLEDSIADVDLRSLKLTLQPAGEAASEADAPRAGGKEKAPPPDGYARVHRSILTGLFGHLGQRIERNLYKTSGNRQIMLFPGSGLFEKNVKPGKGAGPKGAKREEETRQPEWIMAGEMMETTRLYARTAAALDPLWIVELGAHLCRSAYQDPRWDAKSGRVLVRERITLHGLEVEVRQIPFSRVNEEEASRIFIRAALLEGGLEAPLRFLEHNRQVRQKMEIWRTRIRHQEALDLDKAFFDFYAQRLRHVSSAHDLNRVIREKAKTEPDFLCATEKDLAGEREVHFDESAFPSSVRVGEQAVALAYAYAPGEEHDGVTVKLPIGLAQMADPGRLQWIVPGLREEQIACLLRSLPKALRRDLMPIPDTARRIAETWNPEADAAAGVSFLEGLAKSVQKKFGTLIPPSAWRVETLPEYLRPRIEVVGKDAKTLAAGRDLEQLKAQLQAREVSNEDNAWKQAAQRWERYGLTGWTFGDLPCPIEVIPGRGIPIYAYPGLQVEGADVHLRLFRNRDEAELASGAGFKRLAEAALQKEMAWLQKDLRALDEFKAFYVTLGPAEDLKSSAYRHLADYLFEQPGVYPLKESVFQQALEQARARLPGLAQKFAAQVGGVLRLRQELLLCRKPYPGLREDLDRLLPPRFLDVIPFAQIPHLPRYLKAMLVRAERAAVNPPKDQEKARQIQGYAEALKKLRGGPAPGLASARGIDEFRWMLEEFKVSLFAQELGTAYPISARRLDAHLEQLRQQAAAGRA